jgi:ABC transport system ATP-binding/permease protein
LSKSFGARPLFSNLTFAIEEGDRIGLIGPNGAGKSTLLRILSSQAEPSDGELSFQQGLKVGFVEQVPRFSAGATVLSTVLEGFAHPDDWESQGAAREFISRVGLSEFPEETSVEILSGGWKKRLALARELAKKPDLLLLDEPTNHMDVEGIAWLETLLSRAPFAVVVITHDRLFLQRVSNRIIELDPRHAGGLLVVQGDYVKYLGVREQVILAQETREIVLKNTLRRETEWLRQGARARSTKQQARIKKAYELQRDVEELGIRNQTRIARIDFVSAERNPKKLVEAKRLSKAYGSAVVFSDLDLILGPGARVGILGRNGAGKTTLIRTLLGEEPPTSGHVFRSNQLKVAYFDQTREALNPELTLCQTLCSKGDRVEYNGQIVHIRSYLDRFLFPASQMETKVGCLSGGEQSRLLIARLMLNPANLLVLDEPTNDLDIATLNVLEQCLQEFAGAVLLVTHDRYFLDQVTTQLLAFPPLASEERKLTLLSDFGQWEAWMSDQAELGRPMKAFETTREVSAPLQKPKLTFGEKIELEGMEEAISESEELLRRLAQESSLPENVSNPMALSDLSTRMAEAQIQIDRLYDRWADLEKKRC